MLCTREKFKESSHWDTPGLLPYLYRRKQINESYPALLQFKHRTYFTYLNQHSLRCGYSQTPMIMVKTEDYCSLSLLLVPETSGYWVHPHISLFIDFFFYFEKRWPPYVDLAQTCKFAASAVHRVGITGVRHPAWLSWNFLMIFLRLKSSANTFNPAAMWNSWVEIPGWWETAVVSIRFVPQGFMCMRHVTMEKWSHWGSVGVITGVPHLGWLPWEQTAKKQLQLSQRPLASSPSMWFYALFCMGCPPVSYITSSMKCHLLCCDCSHVISRCASGQEL